MPLLNSFFTYVFLFILARALMRRLATSFVAFITGFILFNLVLKPVLTTLSQNFFFFPLLVMMVCVYEVMSFGTPVVFCGLVIMKFYSAAWLLVKRRLNALTFGRPDACE